MGDLKLLHKLLASKRGRNFLIYLHLSLLFASTGGDSNFIHESVTCVQNCHFVIFLCSVLHIQSENTIMNSLQCTNFSYYLQFTRFMVQTAIISGRKHFVETFFLAGGGGQRGLGHCLRETRTENNKYFDEENMKLSFIIYRCELEISIH